MNKTPTDWQSAAAHELHMLWDTALNLPNDPLDEIDLMLKLLEEKKDNPIAYLTTIGRVAAGELQFIVMRQKVLDLIVDRQRKYGTENILRQRDGISPTQAIIVRMGDKVGRLRHGSGDFADDSVLDAWMDLVGYTVIARMLDEDTFTLPLADEADPDPDPEPDPEPEPEQQPTMGIRYVLVEVDDGNPTLADFAADASHKLETTVDNDMFHVRSTRDGDGTVITSFPLCKVNRITVKLGEI